MRLAVLLLINVSLTFSPAAAILTNSMKTHLLIAAVVCGALEAHAAPVVIGYSNAIAAAHLPQNVMDRVGQSRWFFAHASVGENLADGMVALHQANPGYFRLIRSAVTGTPPSTVLPGVFCEFNRGNPGWPSKVDLFADYVNNGWAFPKVDVVVNKFCYIDQAADFNYYISKTLALETNRPQTCVVYVTMPVMTAGDVDDYVRNVFNEALRSWVRTNNRVLLDIADIEAHDTNGVPQTFTYNNKLCQKLFAGYTDDGGHLSTPIAQKNVALGIYALGAALQSADRDGDGMPDWWENANGFNVFDAADAAADRDGDGVSNLKEYVAGTNPSDATSFLRAKIDSCSGGVFQMEFVASSNVSYTVQCISGGLSGSWANLASISPQPTDRTIVFVDATPASSRVYRVAARRDP